MVYLVKDTDVVIVYTKSGTSVQGKLLRDNNGLGSYVINPNTNKPLIVPYSYDPEAAIALGKSFSGGVVPFSDELAVSALTNTLKNLYNAAKHGGDIDLQRNYNVNGGLDSNGNPIAKELFVEAFTDAASYNFGLVGRAAGVPSTFLEFGGGYYNKQNKEGNLAIINDGTYGNNQKNTNSMRAGFDDFANNRYTSNSGSTPAP